MTTSPYSRPVPPGQVRAFHLAVCARLGIDPAIVSESDFSVELTGGDDEMGKVRLTAFLPSDELVAMFNGEQRDDTP